MNMQRGVWIISDRPKEVNIAFYIVIIGLFLYGYKHDECATFIVMNFTYQFNKVRDMLQGWMEIT